jgi:hypothetical protein
MYIYKYAPSPPLSYILPSEKSSKHTDNINQSATTSTNQQIKSNQSIEIYLESHSVNIAAEEVKIWFQLSSQGRQRK